MNDLEQELKLLIIEALKLEDISPEQIDSTEPLFGDGLGLDSIDALELGVALRQKYNIKIERVSAEIKEHFYSIQSLALFITQQNGQL